MSFFKTKYQQLPILKKRISFLLITLFLILIISYTLNKTFPLSTKVSYSKIILANDSTVLHAFLSQDDKWRMKTELHEIIPDLKKTIIHKEDKHFYYHPGFDPFAIGRALFNNIVRGKKTSGASTITMQVARLLEPKKRSYGNKLIEIFRALQLEWYFSKEEILQLYLNLVPYGGNIEGVKSASLLYFGRLPAQLSLAQITALTIIPNRPTSLLPGKNNNLLEKERNKWLTRFKEDQLFNKDEIATAIQEPLNAKRLNAPKAIPHYAYKLNKIYPQEIIRSCIHPAIQQKTEILCYNYTQRLKYKNIHNASIIIMDNIQRKVVAYIGSSDYHDQEHAGQVDGVNALRSPGSTLKPLIYALGFDKGIITPKTVITDVPTNFDGYAPENFDKKFNGNVNIEKALAYSLNVPAVKILEEIEVNDFTEKLTKCGFRQIAKDRGNLGLSIILGGCGVRLEELTHMFTLFTQDGTLYPYHYLNDDSSGKPVKIISPSSAYMINEILTQITRPDLPNNYKNTYHVPQIAWKTGTSYGRRDAWSIGYNKRYTIGVWIGNFSGEGVHELTGADIATPLLFEVFNTIDYNSASGWFHKPEALKFRFVCPHSGKLPGELCEHSIVDYYIPNISDNQKCEHLKPVYISPDETFSYCTTCLPVSGYKKKIYPNHPPELVDFYKSQQITYSKVPEHNPACTRVFTDNAPKIVSPVAGKEYLIEKLSDAEIALRCNAHNEVKRVFWYINNKFYKEAGVTEKVFFKPVEGTIKISCTDDKGRNTDIFITVSYY